MAIQAIPPSTPNGSGTADLGQTRHGAADLRQTRTGAQICGKLALKGEVGGFGLNPPIS
jgi:hypothetical protein